MKIDSAHFVIPRPGPGASGPLESALLQSDTRGGWTVGGGVEFKLTRQFSLGLEFMHTDLGRSTDINGPTAIGATETYGVGLRSNSIMGRFNYLFGQ